MPDCIPNLAGVATKNLVETIGTGSFKASYINWARTFNLLHEHAPGWYLDMVLTPEGEQVWPAPGNGGSLMLRFCHIDGTCLAPVPQAIMDNRNNPIPFDKISARDVTDTHRRGGCMCAAMTFGLAVELWAKMPLESGYRGPEGDAAPPAAVTATNASTAPAEASRGVTAAAAPQPAQSHEPDMKAFLKACLDKGLTPLAADRLIDIIGTNYAAGIKTLGNKTDEWVQQQNADAEPDLPAKTVKKITKPSPEDY